MKNPVSQELWDLGAVPLFEVAKSSYSRVVVATTLGLPLGYLPRYALGCLKSSLLLGWPLRWVMEGIFALHGALCGSRRLRHSAIPLLCTL